YGGENTLSVLNPTLSVERTHITHSSGRGIYVVYSGSRNSQLSVSVSDSELSSNGGSGILVEGPSFNVSPNLSLALTVSSSTISGKGGEGINAAVANLESRDSHIADNSGSGVLIGNDGKPGSLTMRGVSFSGNGGDGVSYLLGMSNLCDLGTVADP